MCLGSCPCSNFPIVLPVCYFHTYGSNFKELLDVTTIRCQSIWRYRETTSNVVGWRREGFGKELWNSEMGSASLNFQLPTDPKLLIWSNPKNMHISWVSNILNTSHFRAGRTWKRMKQNNILPGKYKWPIFIFVQLCCLSYIILCPLNFPPSNITLCKYPKRLNITLGNNSFPGTIHKW